jgi:hypothetical protein
VVGAAGGKRDPNIRVGFPYCAGGFDTVGAVSKVYVKKSKLKHAGPEYRDKIFCFCVSVYIGGNAAQINQTAQLQRVARIIFAYDYAERLHFATPLLTMLR